MLVLVGTLPIDGLPVTYGPAHFEPGKLTVGDQVFEGKYVTLGSAAMISAASVTSEALGQEPPYVITVGDTGMGGGTIEIFNYLNKKITVLRPKVLTLHYIQPTRKEFTELVNIATSLSPKPFLIADAGALLNAKAIGLSRQFDLFTPDPGELSFLADAEAAHPAYVQHFLFEVDNTEVAMLGKQAYEHGNAPRYLLVKSAIDHIFVDGEVIETIKEPLIPALEPIGGTGDTITGIVSALINSGLEPAEACIKAAKINRLMGKLANPTPATPIAELIPYIREAIKNIG